MSASHSLATADAPPSSSGTVDCRFSPENRQLPRALRTRLGTADRTVADGHHFFDLAAQLTALARFNT
jgi:hypothetical protein